MILRGLCGGFHMPAGGRPKERISRVRGRLLHALQGINHLMNHAFYKSYLFFLAWIYDTRI